MEKVAVHDYNKDTQILLERLEDGVPVFEVVSKHPDDIVYDRLNTAKQHQEQARREFQVKQILEVAQTLDDDEALENQAVYPIWEKDISVKETEKYQHFNSDNELVLWKVIQSHITQADWQPKDTPALWLRAGYDGEVLDWVQPAGAHDAYKKGDRVKYNNAVWQSEVDANVFAPGIVVAQWNKLYDL